MDANALPWFNGGAPQGMPSGAGMVSLPTFEMTGTLGNHMKYIQNSGKPQYRRTPFNNH